MSELLASSLAHFEAALGVFQDRHNRLYTVLEDLPAPIYVTDRDGWVVYFNKACVGFAGRRPATGKDRWCVTWRLYTAAGEPLAHADCPMAVAIREARRVRGMVAVAERPDGARVTFTPFPTPLLDGRGKVAGAVNMLIDVSDHRQPGELRLQADQCEVLAGRFDDPVVKAALTSLALAFRDQAGALARGQA